MEKRYSIDSSIFEKYPDFQRAVIVAQNVKNESEMIPDLYTLFCEIMYEIQSATLDYTNETRIKQWTDAYERMGITSKKIKPSVLTLIERIQKGKIIPFISPIVCISNLVSLKFLNPGGLIDGNSLIGNPRLGIAEGHEKFLPFGTDKMINPARGEIIYYDDATNEVLCGAWNSKGGQPSKTAAATQFVIIDIDTFCKDESQTDALNIAVNFTAGLLTKYCNASTSSFLLSKINPEHTFHYTSQSIINRLC